MKNENITESKKTTKFYTKGTRNEVLIGSELGRPRINCGICDFCGSVEYVDKDGKNIIMKEKINENGVRTWTFPVGTITKTMNATECEHYKDVDIMCSFCGEHFTGNKDAIGQFTETLGSRVIKVLSFSDKPDELIMCCSDWTCRRKFFDENGFDL